MENFLDGLKNGYNNLWKPLAFALHGLQSSLVKNLTHPDYWYEFFVGLIQAPIYFACIPLFSFVYATIYPVIFLSWPVWLPIGTFIGSPLIFTYLHIFYSE